MKLELEIVKQNRANISYLSLPALGKITAQRLKKVSKNREKVKKIIQIHAAIREKINKYTDTCKRGDLEEKKDVLISISEDEQQFINM